jgi:cytidylate kinase
MRKVAPGARRSKSALGARRGDLRIAISGKSGCGNSTVSRIVAERLGLRLINYTFKDLGRERGMTFEEICEKAETDSQYDLTIDRTQVDLARAGGFVLGSRLAIWLLRDSAFTVYLAASPEVRAGRIARREGIGLEAALAKTAARDRRDHDRYRHLYSFDVDDYRFAKLVIDTEKLEPQAVAERIVERVSATDALS